MTIVISPADPEDYRAIADVWDRSWQSSSPPCPKQNDLDELSEKLKNPAWEIWAVRESGRIVAFMAIDRAASWLAQLFVDPAAQGCGVGSRLFRMATEKMSSGFSFRTDETNTAGRRFYEQRGCVLQRIEDKRAYYQWQPGMA